MRVTKRKGGSFAWIPRPGASSISPKVAEREPTTMGLEKRTVKIIILLIVVFLVLGAIAGLIVGILFSQRYIELEVWPRSDDYSWEEPLIQFRASDPGSWHPWVRRINEFLKVYETTVPEEPPRAPCTTRHIQEQRLRSPNCEAAMRVWSPCTVDTFYGYATGTPCIFLRLSHIYYWVPEPYNRSLPLSPEMPENLLNIIRKIPAERFGDHIWVTCGGEFSSDQENIGPVQVLPPFAPGFPTRYLRTADHISRATRNMPEQDAGPLVAVYFENPRKGVLINVECRVWSRDVPYNPNSRVGRTRFELYVN